MNRSLNFTLPTPPVTPLVSAVPKALFDKTLPAGRLPNIWA
jgi:hypothetical protein